MSGDLLTDPATYIDDDTDNIFPGEQVLLVVENDSNFARFLIDVAHENGFKAVVATRGAAAVAMAREIHPTAITLDINLPDMDGWRVLNRLKDEVTTRHIPVQIISTDEEHERGIRVGAIGVLAKPVKTKEMLDEAFKRIRSFIERQTRRLLFVHSDEAERTKLMNLIAAPDLEIKAASTGKEALDILRESPCDVIVASFDLSDTKAFDLVDEIKEHPELKDIPIIIYSMRALTKKEEIHLKRLTQSTALKDVRSEERLFDETALFLHRPVVNMTDESRLILEGLHNAGAVLAGKKVLIVDDDIRNIFAMTSILEPQNMQIFSAETGKTAIDTLQANPDIDVVLMDIMMPEMDGYDTMRAIRKLPKFRSLPIIALTAKAMKGDREKCIDAGASDYISKPVDTSQILSLLRIWLHR